ncbi:hypothetical protein ACLOJK_035583 [Asimina triloba]
MASPEMSCQIIGALQERSAGRKAEESTAFVCKRLAGRKAEESMAFVCVFLFIIQACMVRSWVHSMLPPNDILHGEAYQTPGARWSVVGFISGCICLPPNSENVTSGAVDFLVTKRGRAAEKLMKTKEEEETPPINSRPIIRRHFPNAIRLRSIKILHFKKFWELKIHAMGRRMAATRLGPSPGPFLLSAQQPSPHSSCQLSSHHVVVTPTRTLCA